MLPVLYCPGLVPLSLQRVLLPLLRDAIRWETHDFKRNEAFFLRKDVPYYYSSTRGERPLFKQAEPEELRFLWNLVEAITQVQFEACFVNHYMDDSGNLGWHADDSPSIDASRPIVVLSLGATRIVDFRRLDNPDQTESRVIGGGSLYVMKPGMQQAWQHGARASDTPVGERMSLVFRGLSGYVRS